MSLIVDINPVPWEILDLVKARILKNRANRQKRQPEKPGELRRVMQVDNGLLARQRWEEPSFIFGERIPFITIQLSNYFRDWMIAIPPSYSAIRDGNAVEVNVKFNDVNLSNYLHSDLSSRTGYCFIWTSDTEGWAEILGPGFALQPPVDIGDPSAGVASEPYTWKVVPLLSTEPQFFDRDGFLDSNYSRLQLKIIRGIYYKNLLAGDGPGLFGGSSIHVTWGFIDNEIVTISDQEEYTLSHNGPLQYPPLPESDNGDNTEVISSVDKGGGFFMLAEPAMGKVIHSLDPVNLTTTTKIAFFNTAKPVND
jgi:hypothetical protein